MPSERFYDNTRVSDHRSCNRKYFYRHIEGWHRTGSSAPLVFGSAWHEAMNVIWPRISAVPNMSTLEVARYAFEAFEERYYAEGMPRDHELSPEQAEAIGPRTLGTAAEMIVNYIDARREFISKCELLGVEVPFVVPLDPQDDALWYCGRLDKVVRIHNKVHIIEHKTTTQYKINGYFRAAFTDSFSPNSQVDGYLYASHLLYPDAFKGVYIDGALVHKKIHEGFTLIPVERKLDQLDAWLWETREEIRRMEEGLDYSTRLGTEHLPIMGAFPKNTQSCWNYGAPCQFLDLCKMWANPRKHDAEPPMGFVLEKWDPFDHIHLEKLGFHKEGQTNDNNP